MSENTHIKDEHEIHTKGKNEGRLSLDGDKTGFQMISSIISLKTYLT